MRQSKIAAFRFLFKFSYSRGLEQISKKGVVHGKIFKDRDWIHKFRAGNRFPSNSTDMWNFRWLEEDKNKFSRFRLLNDQISNVHTDNKW